jgi:hypothetical protein
MGLEDVVLGLSVILFVAQAFAWRWARGIQRDLNGEIGSQLAGVIAGILGWTLLARIASLAGLYLFDQTRNTNAALSGAIIGQVVGGAVFLWAAFRIRLLRDQTPVDGASEAVVEQDAQPPAEVPAPTVDVGAAVDDAGQLGLPLPAELDESPAG